MEAKPISSWVEIRIFLSDYEQANHLLINHIFPLIATLYLRTWHFFREPEIYIRLLPLGNTEYAKVKFSNRLQDLKNKKVILDYQFGEYSGEEQFYGLKGWPIALQYFNHGTTTAKAIIKQDLPINFHARRYVHLFLNQLGFSNEEEAQFHSDMEKRTRRKISESRDRCI